MITPADFGARWMLPTKTVYRLLKAGRIPGAVCIGERTWRIPDDAMVESADVDLPRTQARNVARSGVEPWSLVGRNRRGNSPSGERTRGAAAARAAEDATEAVAWLESTLARQGELDEAEQLATWDEVLP